MPLQKDDFVRSCFAALFRLSVMGTCSGTVQGMTHAPAQILLSVYARFMFLPWDAEQLGQSNLLRGKILEREREREKKREKEKEIERESESIHVCSNTIGGFSCW
jgi:hypothetical protein